MIIRGRRLHKPISFPNYINEDIVILHPTVPLSEESVEPTKPTLKKKMPRSSPRSHNSSRAADTEIAARLTTLHIIEIKDGTKEIETQAGGPKINLDSPTTINTSSGFHLLEFHGPTISNIVVLGSCVCLTAVGVVILYQHLLSKRR